MGYVLVFFFKGGLCPRGVLERGFLEGGFLERGHMSCYHPKQRLGRSISS